MLRMRFQNLKIKKKNELPRNVECNFEKSRRFKKALFIRAIIIYVVLVPAYQAILFMKLSHLNVTPSWQMRRDHTATDFCYHAYSTKQKEKLPHIFLNLLPVFTCYNWIALSNSAQILQVYFCEMVRQWLYAQHQYSNFYVLIIRTGDRKFYWASV